MADEESGRRLRPVAFDFWWPERPDLNWHLLHLRGREELSTPFDFELELLCDDASIEPEELLGADCELLLDRNGLTRVIFGLIASAELVVAPFHPEQDGRRVRARMVPALRLLDQDVDTRFFMDRTVLEILRDRLGPALAAYGRELDLESRITGQYGRREYCVQFRESTFGFCSRLMEEEGIAYLFVPDHETNREKLVLIDNNAAYPEVELLVPDSVPIVDAAAEELDRESIGGFEWRCRRTPNRVVTRTYRLDNPKLHDEVVAERLDRIRPVVREQYLDEDSHDSRAAHLLERHDLDQSRGIGQANAIGFAAGAVFDLGEAPPGTGGQHQLLLVRVEHHGTVDVDGSSGAGAYFNRFECIPRSRPFRPVRRTPRPRVHGVQTGVVVGREGEEVTTDSLGRVRVRFHRERELVDHEHASCWIRVAQVWAGPGYGAMVIPRVGMEVVVSFVDGDPDRPLVTGCVYHGANPPPHPLPSELSTSTFRSSSTPGGEGFNELRIEDAEGREQIFVHAQRRMDLRVRGRLLETSVGGREEVIGSAESVMWGELKGSYNSVVHGQLNQRVEMERRLLVNGSDYKVANAEVIEDLGSDHLTFVGGLSQLNAAKVVVEASDHVSHKANSLELAGSFEVSVKAGGRVVIQSNNRVEFVVGQSFIALTPTGVDIGGTTIRLNSGGGAEGRAPDGRAAIPATIYEPVDPLTADDGRPGGGGGGGGGGRDPYGNKRTIDPQHAPPMVPPKPVGPEDGHELQGGRRILQIGWLEQEAWCSEPTPLWVRTEGYDGSTAANVVIANEVDGATQLVEVIRPGADAATIPVTISDVVPRSVGDGREPERALRASIGEVSTPSPIRLRFLDEVPKVRMTKGRARFELFVHDHEVVIGSTIEFKRGWIFYIVRLGDTVPEDTGGIIGGKYYGSKDWRYCKREASEKLVFWNGSAWVDVPDTWNSDLGTRLYGMAVWREGEVVKKQCGKLAWPDPVPDTWTVESDFGDYLDLMLSSRADEVGEFWTGKLDLVRNECRSHALGCCRYRVRCRIEFRETNKRTRHGIIITENLGRANASAWPLDDDDLTWFHEFGHHLGNPDEYEGARSVDPSVNGDGAKAGIDREGIMGCKGEVVRRRYFDTVCEAMAEAVREHTGKSFSYRAEEPA